MLRRTKLGAGVQRQSCALWTDRRLASVGNAPRRGPRCDKKKELRPPSVEGGPPVPQICFFETNQAC
jgi:hypothetical protein